MCPSVRSTHVLITSKSSRQPAKPYGIAVSGVLSVSQSVFVAKEKNAATVCGSDSVATDNPFQGGFGAWDGRQRGGRSMRRGREKYDKDSRPGAAVQAGEAANRA